MLEKLNPISEKHSVSRAIATLFAPQFFVKPQDVFEKLQSGGHFEEYQKKGLLNNKVINIENDKLTSSPLEVNGFIFENFGERGKIENILKLENLKPNGKALISFETRKYNTWDTFLDRFIKDINNLKESNDFYIEAISLTYVDEFSWNDSDNDIAVESIFNTNSELLNRKFIKAKNGTLVLLSQGKKHGYNSEERTEISFNNDMKRIVLNHQYAISLNEFSLLSVIITEDQLKHLFTLAHNENKDMLRDVLTAECLTKIGLKQ